MSANFSCQYFQVFSLSIFVVLNQYEEIVDYEDNHESVIDDEIFVDDQTDQVKNTRVAKGKCWLSHIQKYLICSIN